MTWIERKVKKLVTCRGRLAFRKSCCFVVTISAAKKTLSFWQLASVVIQEGEESFTTNLCQKCYNESLKAKGDEPLTKWFLAVGVGGG